MSYTKEEIYDFSLYVQCKLADKAEEISMTLSYKDLCIEEKLRFILANIYKVIIRNYNPDSCVTDESMCKMISFIKKYLKETSFNNNNCNCN